ncbi:MAG: MinD/ParA family protein [Planctomycetota bacterium]
MTSKDQAARLRALMQDVRHTHTIAVTSGKGGVGKSNIALNLAVLLSASGNRVALLDADFGLANLDVLVDAPVRANLAHVVAGQRKLADVVVDLPCGVQLVPGASGLAQMADLNDFQRSGLIAELNELEENNDVIVVDTGAGISKNVLTFAGGADSVLVVATAEPTSITDAYAVVKVLHQQGSDARMSLLVNFAADRTEARATYNRIATVAREFLGVSLYDAGYILNDPRVSQAVRKRQPYVLAYPRCQASRCLAALATKLCRGGGLLVRNESFFRRVANWFS